MNEDRIVGSARTVAEKSRKQPDKLRATQRTRVEGELNQAAGRAQDLYGQAKDAAADAVDALEDSAETFEDAVRDFVETRPYTTAAIALGIGWLIGTMGRRRYD